MPCKPHTRYTKSDHSSDFLHLSHASLSKSCCNMNILLLIVVLALSVLVQNAYGLDCKICYVDNGPKPDPAANSCQVLPCNSKEDLENSYLARWKSETGQEATPEQAAKVKEAGDTSITAQTKFVCSRSMNKLPKLTMIVSMCTALTDGFPAADNAYPIKDYLLKISPGVPQEILSQYEGDIYICDEKTGNGKNCGADPDLSISVA